MNKETLRIIWYFIKYFVVGITTLFTWQYAGKLCSQKDDFQNIIGYLFFTGLTLAWILLIKSELTKSVIETEVKKENETE